MRKGLWKKVLKNRKRRMQKSTRWRRKASFTVETAVVMSVVFFTFASAVNLGIYLYSDTIETAQEEIREPVIHCGKLMRIKHMGGEIYERYDKQYQV